MNVSNLGNSLPANSRAQSVQGPPPPRGERPSHSEAVADLGASLSEEVRNEMLDEIQAMQDGGASNEEIKDFVHESLEAQGISIPDRRPGMLANVKA